MADTFTVRVTYTDRSRHSDRTFVEFYSTVEVLADSDTEATMVASQMVDAIRFDIDGMVIAARVIDVRI